jgi:trafficking kinesin-binding protein 2
MINNFKKEFNGDYGVKLTPDKLKFLCEVDWPAFGVGWPLEGSLDNTVVNKVYKVVVKKKRKRKNPNAQDNGKIQEAKIGLQKPDSVIYLNSGSNLLSRLRRNQSLSVLMGSFGAPVCTSSPKMGILKED